MEWITNVSAEKLSFPMLKQGLIKKFWELSSLTDVEAGMILYKPGELHLEIWPNIPDALRIFSKYSTKKENQVLISKHQVEETSELLHNLILENCKMETKLLLSDYLEGKSIPSHCNMKGLSCLASFVAMRIDQVTKRMDIVMENIEKQIVTREEKQDLHGKKLPRRRYMPKVESDPSYRFS